MKLGKDEIQKIFLGFLLLLGVVYSYFNLLLGPLEQRQAATRKSIAALEPEIAAARAQLQRTRDAETAAPVAKAVIDQVNAMIPEGSPVAWFPTRMGDFFKKAGIDKAATRMNSETEEKELAGFRRINWSVDLPKLEFMPFGAAIAQLENEEPLLQIATVQIDASRDDAENQHAILNVHNLVKQ